MSENDLMNYCEKNGFQFVSQDIIESDLKSGGVFSLRVNPEKYYTGNGNNVCISAEISDIDKYNVNDYDFDKMISEINLPSKYYDITLDNTPFMVRFDSKPTADGDMEPYFIKLANFSVKIKAEFAKSETALRLYQLIRILPQSNSSFDSISVQYSGMSDISTPVEDITDFDNLLKMTEDELKKYCEQSNLKYVTADEAEGNIKSSGIINAMMKVDKYNISGEDDMTKAYDISFIDKTNTAWYDFSKMKADLNLPEKYYDVNVDAPSFDLLQDYEIIDGADDEKRVFFIKLARIPIKVKGKYADSVENVRLHQLAMIWSSNCSEVHSFSIQYLGGSNTTDFLPETQAEYESFLAKYGEVSVHGKYIVYCVEVNYSTGAELILKQSGNGEIRELKKYTISESTVGVGGDSTKTVCVYEAVSPGTVKVDFIQAQPWNMENIHKQSTAYFAVDDDLNVAKISENEFIKPVKGDANGDGEFGVADTVLLQKWILGDSSVELQNWKAADLCEDGTLDVFDMCFMRKLLVDTYFS